MPDRVVFDHVIAALVHGSGYERIATPGCSDRTIRRRLDDWAAAGIGEAVLRAALAGYDQIIGLGAYETPIDKMLSLLPQRVTLELVPDQGAEPRPDGL